MNHESFQKAGALFLRYGLAVVLCWIGLLKFSTYEAQGIQPLVENSPILSWNYRWLSIQAFSEALGVTEILSGLLIAGRAFDPRLAAIGGIAGIITFLITLTLLLSTPGIIQPGYSFPFISPMPGQFLIKDLVLLGAATYITGEALVSIAAKKAGITNHLLIK